ncbi:MAG: acetate--CoA ligase family protein, partial [bacterium]
GNEVFQAYGLPVAPFRLALDAEQAIKAANAIGYPVVVKIASADILHKTEAKGVKVGLANAEEVRQATAEVIANAKAYKANAKIDGVLVQKMAPKGGTEVIFGAIKDATFQQTVMFGLGGIFVEVLKDVTFRVAPVSPQEARKMVTEIAAYPIIKGARGQKPRDEAALAQALARLSQLVVDFPEIKELDANPVMVYEDGLLIVDSVIKLQ